MENTHQGTLGWRREGEHMEYFGGFKEKKKIRLFVLKLPKGRKKNKNA